MLPDNDPLVTELRKFLLSAPADFLTVVLSQFWHRAPIQQWHLDLCIELLLSSRWLSLESQAIQAAFEMLRQGENRVSALLDMRQIDSASRTLLKELLESERHSVPGPEDEVADFGYLRASYHKPDWVTGKLAQDSLNALESSTSRESPGILEFIRRAQSFARAHGRDDLCSVLRVLQGAPRDLRYSFPRRIRAWIPLVAEHEMLGELLQQIQRMPDEVFQNVISNRRVASFRLRRDPLFAVEEKEPIKKFDELLEEAPQIALYVRCDPRVPNHSMFDQDANPCTKSLIDCLLSCPQFLVRCPFWWGRIAKDAKDREPELRSALVSAGKRGDPADVHGWFSEDACFPLEISLPSESALLPHALAGIVNRAREFSQRGESPTPDHIDRVRAQTASFVGMFVPDACALRNFIAEVRNPIQERGAAAVMLLLHPQGGIAALPEATSALVDCSGETGVRWLIDGLAMFLSLYGTEDNSTCRAVAARVLDRIRDDFSARQKLDTVLRDWRETSHAPVTNALLQDRWLAGE